jgi:hypothetical protein
MFSRFIKCGTPIYIYIYMLVDTRLEKRRYIFVFTIYMCGTPLYYKVLMTGWVKIGSDQKIIRLKQVAIPIIHTLFFRSDLGPILPDLLILWSFFVFHVPKVIKKMPSHN